MIRVTTSWRNDNPNTVWNRLAAKLGREPTNAEAAQEVKRILQNEILKRAGEGKLTWQRRQTTR